MEKTIKHTGVLGMKWGVRRNRPGHVGATISAHSPLRNMTPIFGKKKISNRRVATLATLSILAGVGLQVAANRYAKIGKKQFETLAVMQMMKNSYSVIQL